jgi:hypothetical protein
VRVSVSVRMRVRMVHILKFTADQLFKFEYLGWWNPGSYFCTALPIVGIGMTSEKS